MLCFILFISVVMSKSLVVEVQKSVDGDSAMFMSYEFDKCYYTDEFESQMFTHDGDQITIDYYAESSSCSGNKKSETFNLNDKKFKEEICDESEEDDCAVEIKKAPKHIGFKGEGDDDDNCSHRDDTIRLYYTDKCFKCSDDKYCNYEVDNGWMYLNKYPNDKCNSKERTKHEQKWECDKCNDGTMQQCGTISTMILFVVFAIFALIL
ncbi:hypothetical protein CL6EHI_004070 [Entamoeba histolytica]|uniref:Uncharacterized protein n=4 Tax=Entamoeba histolytica TaxID=5759 RepID=C4MBL0_ENTH1|nr:hypothetical protein EHI_004070 [Entamoeba histolytica HM-1:IMSS]EAL42852.2 hypothetical protein EHI_004070 [Entamoeba histolytica HM-1:IMSS]EMD43961.1 Hypothetical protein EHI5A_162630 [Entamoeba histolytica KU27]GAT99416.1 hypothetical protein CL6EHI_004070 [Entamoeba histolytica]|eukprot:XP_648238.2 hypothetical protein EHI_004070 [Entamoeba histolytica HM-1:IMSS]